MVTIKYERYWNDLRRKYEERSFPGLDALADWIFGQMKQHYTTRSAMSFPTPEAVKRIGANGPWEITFKPQYGGETICIHLIEGSDGIVFSDGQLTSGKKHWSPEIKQWLTACETHQLAPTFNFTNKDTAPAESAPAGKAATYAAVIRASSVRDVQFAVRADAEPCDGSAWRDLPEAEIFLGFFSGPDALAEAAKYAGTVPENVRLVPVPGD